MKTTKTIRIGKRAPASRVSAGQVRLQAEALIGGGQVIAFDFDGVESVSASYADELLGVLARDYGLDWIADNVVIYNAEDSVWDELSQVILERLESTESRQNDLLKLEAL